MDPDSHHSGTPDTHSSHRFDNRDGSMCSGVILGDRSRDIGYETFHLIGGSRGSPCGLSCLATASVCHGENVTKDVGFSSADVRPSSVPNGLAEKLDHSHPVWSACTRPNTCIRQYELDPHSSRMKSKFPMAGFDRPRQCVRFAGSQHNHYLTALRIKFSKG